MLHPFPTYKNVLSAVPCRACPERRDQNGKQINQIPGKFTADFQALFSSEYRMVGSSFLSSHLPFSYYHSNKVVTQPDST